MNYSEIRHIMVESQIRPHGVTDTRILEAVEAIPREQFVPADKADIAYIDDAIKFENGRFMTSPMVLARLLQGAELRENDVALFLSSANGYGSAILSHLVATVVALEDDKSFALQISKKLSSVGSDNVVLIDAPLSEGYAKQAPYDVILFEGAVSEIPAAISAQLAEGGRLVAILKNGIGLGKAVLVTRVHGMLNQRQLFDVNAPFLPGFEEKPRFRFAG